MRMPLSRTDYMKELLETDMQFVLKFTIAGLPRGFA